MLANVSSRGHRVSSHRNATGLRHGAEPSAQIWVGGDGKMRYFYRPALLTLQAGLLSSNISAQVTSWDYPKLRELKAGDLFIFVGVFSLDSMTRHFKNLTASGVLTVFYATEADFGHPCSQKQKLHVREVWEYTQSNVLCCAGASRRPWRYVPPGYIPREVLASTSSSALTPQLTFVGSANVHYDKRRSCLRQVARGLMMTSVNGSTHPKLGYCVDKLCSPAECLGSCGLRVRYSLFDDNRMNGELTRSSSYLNVHKACNGSALVSNAACESFRFAPLLSAGAEIFSEHCHSADEREYEGLIKFGQVGELAAAAAVSWRSSDVSTARARAHAFKERFAPSAIFERAGITAMLSDHRARWRAVGRQHHQHLDASNLTQQTGQATTLRPAYCRQ